ncbi:AAA family ATPase [Sphaerochaeta halotolerans]|uniref:AAA family ATPase n=1 Tax=Sphaerochaeta halotolerans TaxID=2293840 RepID=UPI00136A71C4|nr:ATP-binding protein [Sphaerochaeta halotolerans]MXI85364.1 ATP-binding protein [Sphaerochaeta halotolerans]
MILLEIKLDNFFSFNNFHLSLTYPKKISNSTITDEYLEDRPNFRYKKLIVLMGANATGKTTLGNALIAIFNFITKKSIDPIANCIDDTSKPSSFSMDFITHSSIKTMYRIVAQISPPTATGYREEDISLTISSTSILKTDSYERCVAKLRTINTPNSTYIEALDLIDTFGWYFSYPFSKDSFKNLTPVGKKSFRIVLETVLRALDPSIQGVRESQDIENSYIIRLNNHDLIMKNNEILNSEILSSGTRSGVDIAVMLSSIISSLYGFYYCDEKFSYIHSDMEKAILSKMIEKLGANEQLFFTTHNADILDMSLPIHSYIFLKKEIFGHENRISCVYADQYLKRNTDSLRRAVENDIFSVAPNVDDIDRL